LANAIRFGAPNRISTDRGRKAAVKRLLLAVAAMLVGGTATVVVKRPDGRTRAIFFEKGRSFGADLS